jgi:hypothetical protein
MKKNKGNSQKSAKLSFTQSMEHFNYKDLDEDLFIKKEQNFEDLNKSKLMNNT